MHIPSLAPGPSALERKHYNYEGEENLVSFLMCNVSYNIGVRITSFCTDHRE